MKKVIIIDDESSARSLIKEYLEDHQDYIVMQECNNGVDAVKSVNNLRPDLVARPSSISMPLRSCIVTSPPFRSF